MFNQGRQPHLTKTLWIKIGKISSKIGDNSTHVFTTLILSPLWSFNGRINVGQSRRHFPDWSKKMSLAQGKESFDVIWLQQTKRSLRNSVSQLFANWYPRLLALIKLVVEKYRTRVTNGLSDTIYRIINIAPCLRHWIGIESVIDIPSFLVVISQRKWNKISTSHKKPYQVLYFVPNTNIRKGETDRIGWNYSRRRSYLEFCLNALAKQMIAELLITKVPVNKKRERRIYH